MQQNIIHFNSGSQTTRGF